ncbi:hypothetical protein BDQ17DRAFT_1267863 [Cyathus striatus]|nr:hypothetical protein BDQ17DRAFT_1267863 [Cyathus striatus]
MLQHTKECCKYTSPPLFPLQHYHVCTQNPNAPPPPEYVKQMEKQIAREGTIEEKNLKHAIKDLSNAEKVKTKAAKSENKAEHALDKAGRNEHAALQALGKATNKHDIAVANVHAAENSLQVSFYILIFLHLDFPI